MENLTEGSIGQRLRRAVRARYNRLYFLAIAGLFSIAILSLIIFGFRRGRVLIIQHQPMSPRPHYLIKSVSEMPVARQERLTVTALIHRGLSSETLRATLDWIIFSVLDEYNRIKRRNIQVVWVYLYEDSIVSLASWRAMAVYVDPKLPSFRVPDAARIGGDAIKEGAVEYDFTNPVKIEEKR